MQAKDSPEAKAEPKTKVFSQGIISDCCVCFTKKIRLKCLYVQVFENS